jgi:RNA recognition motif-containing protein
MKIYVGNMSYGVTSEDLRTTFSEFGSVDSAEVILDRSTNRSKGFGFVEMPDDEEAKAAINGLNGKEMDGRTLNVSEARPRAEGPRGGGGGGGGYGGPPRGGGGGVRDSRRF